MSQTKERGVFLTTSQIAFLALCGGITIGLSTFGIINYYQTNKHSRSRRHSIKNKPNPLLSPLPLSKDHFTWDSVSDDIVIRKNLSTEDRIKDLANEISRLRNLLTIARASQYDVANRNTLTPSDIETIRVIFTSIDQDDNGYITADEFNDLHTKLGEPLTDKELNDALKILDPQNTSKISFDSFLVFWQKQHKGGKSNKTYREKFKFVSAMLKGEFDISKVITKDIGTKYTPEFRISFNYIQPSGELKKISPWHDIPLHHLFDNENDRIKNKLHINQTIYNFICEVPKYTRAKFEIATGELFNPIKQDVKNGKLRFYQHGDMMFNYGAFPQTWENPDIIPEETGYPGDNDPLDAIELGTKQLATGTITAVKCLGVLGLLDSGETDWKILCISISDPLATIIHDIHDIDKFLPGAIVAIREFMRIYKVCTGSEENKYAFGGEALNRSEAVRVVEEAHNEWKKLKVENRQTV